MLMNGAQPAFRAGEKGERTHHHSGDAKVEAAEPGPDEPHVVVKREPADEDVLGFDLSSVAERSKVGQEVAMRQDHSLGLAGAS
ncbi:hypothetical protein D3C87_1429770 [compost metagenome]